MEFKKSYKTRQILLETAAMTIATFGLEKTTARLLAKRAGVSLGCVTRNFPKFSDLFPEVIRYIFEQLVPEVRKRSPQESGEELFCRIVRQNFDFFIFQKPHYERCLLLSYFYVGIEAKIGKAQLKALNDSIVATDNILVKIAHENQLKIPENERRLLARTFLEHLVSSLASCTFTKEKLKRKQILEDTLQIIKLRFEHMKKYYGSN